MFDDINITQKISRKVKNLIFFFYTTAVVSDTILMSYACACILASSNVNFLFVAIVMVLLPFSWFDLQRSFYSAIDRAYVLLKDRRNEQNELKVTQMILLALACVVGLFFTRIFYISNELALRVLLFSLFGIQAQKTRIVTLIGIGFMACSLSFFNTISMISKYFRLLMPENNPVSGLSEIKGAVWLFLTLVLTAFIVKGPYASIQKTIQAFIKKSGGTKTERRVFKASLNALYYPMFLLTFSQVWDVLSRLSKFCQTAVSGRGVETFKFSFDRESVQNKSMYMVLTARAMAATIKTLKKRPSLLEGSFYMVYHFFDKKDSHYVQVNKRRENILHKISGETKKAA